MGFELMQLAMVHGSRLPGRPYKVLLRMSWQALDRDQGDRPARLYFGGWEPLALAMGFEVPKDDAVRLDTIKRNVKRAVRELVDAELIEAVGGRPGFGTRQTYRILLDLAGGSLRPPNRGADSTPHEGATLTPQQGGQNTPPWGVDLTPPRKEEDQLQESDQDQPLTAVVTLPVATGCALCGGRTTSEGDCVNPRCAHPSTGEGAPLRRAR